MKAWEIEQNFITQAVPVLSENTEENWFKYSKMGHAADEKLLTDWENCVPGSFAPCHLVLSAIMAVENKGFDVTEAMNLYYLGAEAFRCRNLIELHKITSLIYEALNNAPKDAGSDYHQFREYLTFGDVMEDSEYEPSSDAVDVMADSFQQQIHSGWMAQLIGASVGTQMEGYVYNQIKKAFGEIKGYLKTPETFNDDITYELAFLDAFEANGYGVSSKDIALSWVGIVPDGYSAEEIALRNITRGIMPPESGRYLNYYSDWIGAQMRSAICGMVAPGDPKLAASLAWRDSVVSHSNNGAIGGIFNALLNSLAFVENDVRSLVKRSIKMLPIKSEYYSLANQVLIECENGSDWETVWTTVEERFKKYHWIHAYPNMAAEIVALWFGSGNFDRTLNIICLVGKDTDCNAGMIMTAIGIMKGIATINEKWIKPLNNTVRTYMRKYNEFQIQELSDRTIQAVRLAYKNAKRCD